MPRTVIGRLEMLFQGAGPVRQPLNFEWRLIRRKGRPFLLLPASPALTRASLELYSAQRTRAKFWRSLLPWCFRTPAVAVFPRLLVQADGASEMMQFLSEQAGVPAQQIRAMAIKFGGHVPKSRLTILVFDAAARPFRVIKVGLDEKGREATEREMTMLEQLPAHTIGSVRMSGQLRTPSLTAFATAFFPGDSPANDSGMEQVFRAWLNPGPPEPLETLEEWRELASGLAVADPCAWRGLTPALAGQMVRTTLYHGDYAPWNIRMTNLETIRAFDWERGQLRGIPGWDWFHYIVQTSILVKRHSPERVAAELEQLIHSTRFRDYAVAAGIDRVVRPLVLAYLLQQIWVVKPLEGRRTTEKLYELLALRWRLNRPVPAVAANPQLQSPTRLPIAAPVLSGAWRNAARQLQSTLIQLGNLFWEPRLSPPAAMPLRVQLATGWPVALACALLLGAVVMVQTVSTPHALFLPLYLMPCALLTLLVDRRLGAAAALLAAAIGPVVQRFGDADYRDWSVLIWNIAMRFFILQLANSLLYRLQQQRAAPPALVDEPDARTYEKLVAHWPVILVSSLIFTAVVLLHLHANPHLIFLPLYLLPCLVLTLALDGRWGAVAGVVAAVVGPIVQRMGDADFESTRVEAWNIGMRLFIFLLLVQLLDRIRGHNVLFTVETRQPL